MSTEDNQGQKPRGNQNDFHPEDYVTADVLIPEK